MDLNMSMMCNLHLEAEEARHEMALVKASLKSLAEIQKEIFSGEKRAFFELVMARENQGSLMGEKGQEKVR